MVEGLIANLLLHYPNFKWPKSVDHTVLTQVLDSLDLPPVDRPAGHYHNWGTLVCLRCKDIKDGTDEYRASPYLPYCPKCCHNPSYIDNIKWSLDSIWLPTNIAQLAMPTQHKILQLVLDKIENIPHDRDQESAGIEE